MVLIIAEITIVAAKNRILGVCSCYGTIREHHPSCGLIWLMFRLVIGVILSIGEYGPGLRMWYLYNFISLQSDLADSILEKKSMRDDDIDDIFDILSALSSLSDSVSSLNATVGIIGNLVGVLSVNSSLISTDRGQVIY